MTAKADKQSLFKFLGSRVSVQLDDHSTLIGRLVSLGPSGNLILTDVERIRPLKRRRGSTARECYDKVLFVRGGSVVAVHHTSSLTSDPSVVDNIAGSHSEVEKTIQIASQSLNMPLRARSVSRSRVKRPPSVSTSKTLSKAFTGQRTGPTVSWKVNERGRIVNFDLKTLRGDIVRRLSAPDLPLYTLKECRAFLIEIAAVAAAWQGEEIPHLIYLSDLHEKLLPGKAISYQWPAADADVFPSADEAISEDGAMPMIAQVVEEMNRSIVRMIDRIWDSRRDRMLFAARLLQDIEPMLAEVHEDSAK